jgi:hypothetical protein|tara:strand:+ start:39 stop:185 length:147 start_codon:yes stop_codon:yes gene_type:complete
MGRSVALVGAGLWATPEDGLSMGTAALINAAALRNRRLDMDSPYKPLG